MNEKFKGYRPDEPPPPNEDLDTGGYGEGGIGPSYPSSLKPDSSFLKPDDEDRT